MKRTSSICAFSLAAALALAALVLFSCEDNPSDNNAETKLRIAPYAGNSQTERTGAMLADPLIVKVTDILGNAKSGIAVFFSTQETSAYVSPASVTTDAEGLASCRFRLGSTAGPQRAKAVMQDDSTSFNATAVAPGCAEESPERLCQWPAGHVFIATTGSSLSSGAGTVILDYNPANKEITKVQETTTLLLEGISFSSRGELFISSPDGIRKVNSTSHVIEDYIAWAGTYNVSLDPNEGSILVGLATTGPLSIGCAASGISFLLPTPTFSNIKWENLAVDPLTRDIYLITEFSPTNYALRRIFWDGHSPVQSFEVVANLSVGAAAPAGICIDSIGTVYITFDGNDTYRRIVSVAADGTINYNFFNFYTHAGGNSQEAGRWGDIAYLNGRLYLIDRRMDRLVIISREGQWLDEVKSTAFSRPFDESEHYAICASPTWLCILSPAK